MVYDYVIILKRPDTRIVDVISHILYSIAFSSFTFFAFASNPINRSYLLFAAAILVSWIWIIVKKRKGQKVYFTAGLAFAIIGWTAQGDHRNMWLAALYLVAALAEREFKFPKEIGVSAEDIVQNSLFKKRYQWNDVRNAMIKDDILTIDLKSNKVIQKEIADGASRETELEFNEFCKQQLLKNSESHEVS